MENAAITDRSHTVDEYLRLEQESIYRHEYVGGGMFLRHGSSSDHNLIVGNVAVALRNAARGSSFNVLAIEVQLQVSDEAIYYPDIMVCDASDDGEYIKRHPCVVVEVMSPETEMTDRREKLLAYRRLDSLKAYIMVYEDQRRVMSHFRGDEGLWWKYGVEGDGVVDVPCLDVLLTLDDVYERTTL